MHAQSPARRLSVPLWRRGRSSTFLVDGARGEPGSCLSRAHPPTLGIWWSRSRMGMAPRVMSRCGSCPRPLPGSCSLIRTMGGQSSLCVPPWEGGEVCVVSVSVCLPECDQCARLRVDRRSLFYYVSCGLSRKGGMCHLCRLGAGSVHGGTPDSTRLVICTHFPNACTISGASVECSLVATRSIVDVLGRRRSRRAWLLPFAGQGFQL